MAKSKSKTPHATVRPNGADRRELPALPAAGIKRWSPRRKATLIAAVKCGALSIESASEMYGLTREEMLWWQTQVEEFGPQGLFVTKVQRCREGCKRQKSKPK